jgi:hypothetical protein
LLTLGARFDHKVSPEALEQTKTSFVELERAVGQVRWVLEESNAVLNRSAGVCRRLVESTYCDDERSTLPTLDHATAGRLVEFLG